MTTRSGLHAVTRAVLTTLLLSVLKRVIHANSYGNGNPEALESGNIMMSVRYELRNLVRAQICSSHKSYCCGVWTPCGAFCLALIQ